MLHSLEYYYALWRKGKLPPERIPDLACDALQEGMDTPQLRYLAGLGRPTVSDIGIAFDDAWKQLGIVPTPEAVADAQVNEWIESAIPAATDIAKQILGGSISPVEAWLRLPYRNDQPLGPLSVFFEFADREGQRAVRPRVRRQGHGCGKSFPSPLV